MAPVDTDLLTAAQAAVRAGVNRRTITRWADTGRLPVALQLPGDTGANLFRPADVDAAVAARASEDPSSTAEAGVTR